MKSPDDMECIRCGDCVKSCPTRALSAGFYIGKRKIGEKKNIDGEISPTE
jgi:ferredoxin